ncbi:MAG TPA: nucleoside triphosphate pyrophosphohydrolase [Treponema sp.]|nr:nucleoside triphosphate pyrophosphohydrolase [Treponema sp.]
MSETKEALFSLYEIAKRLMQKDGCPWDREQTPLTMRQYLIEETFEAVDAISQEDASHAKEELGDVLYNVIFISYLYELRGDFTLAEVADEMHQKLVRRHPHVFGEQSKHLDTKEQVKEQWDQIKHTVEGREKKSVLDEVPASFPPLLKAFKYIKKAASKGFDWPTAFDALKKVSEETQEVRQALEQNDSSAIEEELGDLLLSVVAVCKKCSVSPDAALSRSLKKFYNRYTHVEENSPTSLEQMLALWNEAKNTSIDKG